MKLSRRIIWSVISIVVIVIAVFTVIVYMDDDNTNPNAAENNEDETIQEDSKPQTDTKDTKKADSTSTLDPFNQKHKQEELTDTHFRNYIHKMSHQKVIAEDKWGFYEITNERIAWLLESLETDDVRKRLTDGDVYLEILDRWANDDFSRVDEDHNVIWRLQGGNIGKATGIYDKEQEEAYIKSTDESK